MSFRDAIIAIKGLAEVGIVSDYAVGGAMALIFWSEPVPTYDLDVFVLLPAEGGPITSLAPLYEWAGRQGYPVRQEHIVIGDVPVQVIPAHSDLAEEAVREAVSLEYEGIAVRVILPEHLIGLYLEPSARTRKRLERVAALLEGNAVDRSRLDSILSRHGLTLPAEHT
jgi:hypothetical protein